MKYITAQIDLGEKETFQKYNGKFLEESDAQDLITVTEDTAIMKPGATLDGSGVPLAYVICNAFPNDNVRNVLATIEDTSTMRANCSGPIDKEAMAAKGLIENEHYKLRTPNSYYVRTKSGGWGIIAYAAEIHSVMIGYKRGRFTGAIDASGWTKSNPEKFEILKEIAVYNEKAFKKANSVIYNKQKKFAENSIRPEHRIGIFTTLSANRYHVGQSSKMSAHVDSSDTHFGMTSMAVFREGAAYQGAYLLFPRYGIGIDAPDNSVVIAQSLEIHGVSPIRGNGVRLSAVAYCDNRLASIGVAGKPERKIGKYAEQGNLESLFE